MCHRLDVSRRAVEWLNGHSGPDDAVRNYWALSRDSRQRMFQDGCTIKYYFASFPALKTAIGAELVFIKD